MPKKLFITITPPDRVISYVKMKVINPLRHVFYDDKNLIESAFSTNKIKIYVIYPELSPKGRLHYHGVITLTGRQEVSFYKSIRPRLERIGFVDTQPVKHDIECILYCRKQWYLTSEILDVNLPITPLFLSHTVGGRKGFKSRRDLDVGLVPTSQKSIVEYLEGLSPKDT